MWTLECDGDLFKGKKLWLRPGATYFFGRTKPPAGDTTPDERVHVIEDKSVSRKHLIISIPQVAAGSATDLESVTEVQLTDQSKLGTTLDTQKFKDKTVKLTKHEHLVQLGNYHQKFRIKWVPVVLTPASVRRNSEDVLREKIERFDIKFSLEYETGHTTHVIGSKRNLPKCLQALLNAKYVVTEAYVDALVETASGSTLEEDFQANFPDPLKFATPAGREPNPRPDSYLAPNASRSDVFSGYTFIFCDRGQFETLGDIVNGGSGKAQFYDLVQGRTIVDDFVRYAKGFSGQKVVVVRVARDKDGGDEWKINLGREIELALDQRSIEQNEFLDVILANDATTLKRQLQEEIVIDSSAPPPRDMSAPARSQRSRQESQPTGQEREMASATANQAPAEAAQSAPTRRKTYRAPYKSRFAGFDDFDPSQLSKAQPGDEDGIGVDSPVQESTPANGTSHDESQQAGPSQSARGNARKRPASPDEDDFIDEIIPAAAASKRRKLEEQRRNGSGNAAGAPAPRPKSAAVQAAEKFRKAREKAEKGGEIDLLALARSKVEEQEEKARREAEDLQEAMAGADINEKLDPAVEEMEMPAPRERETFASGEAGERWNDRWNGRKNFKRFKKVRKRGTQNDAPSRPSRVIVGMEEAKNKDLGIGEEYWLESGSKNSSRKNRDSAFATQRTSQQTSQSVTQRGDRQKGGDQQEKRRGAAKRVVEEDDIEPDDVELDDAPRSGSRGTQGEVARGKRKADGPPEAEERQATKRRTTMRSRRDDDDSDESGDDLRFRLRKK